MWGLAPSPEIEPVSPGGRSGEVRDYSGVWEGSRCPLMRAMAPPHKHTLLSQTHTSHTCTQTSHISHTPITLAHTCVIYTYHPGTHFGGLHSPLPRSPSTHPRWSNSALSLPFQCHRWGDPGPGQMLSALFLDCAKELTPPLKSGGLDLTAPGVL